MSHGRRTAGDRQWNCPSFTASLLSELGFQEAKLGSSARVIGNGKGTGVSAFSEVLHFAENEGLVQNDLISYFSSSLQLTLSFSIQKGTRSPLFQSRSSSAMALVSRSSLSTSSFFLSLMTWPILPSQF